jgi:hypothetical protein
MKSRPLFALAAASLAMTTVTFAHAQAGRVAPAAQATRQAPPAGTATFGLPNPSGLSSPTAGGLVPPTAPSLTPPGSPNLSSPGTPPGSPVVDAGIAQPYAPGGGAGYVGAAAMGAGSARGPVTSVDIARAFLDADMNRDGELSRTEALRAGLGTAFDDLDRNRDGVLSRSEFDDAFR